MMSGDGGDGGDGGGGDGGDVCGGGGAEWEWMRDEG